MGDGFVWRGFGAAVPVAASGDWEFLAAAWVGVSGDLEGDVRSGECALADDIVKCIVWILWYYVKGEVVIEVGWYRCSQVARFTT